MAIADLAAALRADLVVVGPEAPLVAGLADRLDAPGIACFGPVAAAALIEGSKAFAKEVMAAAGVPTAGFTVCDTPGRAQLAIAEADGQVVVKADGLAAGKGVVVCDTAAEAEAAVRACLVDGRFGGAGARVLIEQRLEGAGAVAAGAVRRRDRAAAGAGPRLQARAATATRGRTRAAWAASRPCPASTLRPWTRSSTAVHRPVVAELARRGVVFRGCLYAGLMLTADGPRVIEFNARWGDPETQALVPRLDGDLLEALLATAEGRLAGVSLDVGRRGLRVDRAGGARLPGCARAGGADLGRRSRRRAGGRDGVPCRHDATATEPWSSPAAGC